MDPNTARGFAIMPSYGRPTTNLPRFFNAAAKTGMTIPGYVVVDQDDYARHCEDYDALALPDNWSIHIVQGGNLIKATNEAAADLFSDHDFLFWLADDLVPETPEWDKRVIEALNGFNWISTNDGWQAPRRFNGATAWSGDLLRTMGYVYPPQFSHAFGDDVVETIGRECGNWSVLMDVMVRHLHPAITSQRDDTNTRTDRFLGQDEREYQKWRQEEYKPAVERVVQLIGSYGVTMMIPKLSGLRVAICTPCGSGRYEGGYVDSLIDTMAMIRQYGGECGWVKADHISDISLARNRIFGNFLRSDYTHALWIDDDMIWRPQDAVRLLMAKRDFCAAAGPRKVSPPSYAVTVQNARGEAIPLNMDSETGMLEATGVGGAFVCMTREMAIRLSQSYPELKVKNSSGSEDYCVYNNMIVDGRYLSEDYALCHRWRAIGGKVWVDPTIELGHIGSHEWKGSWLSQLQAKINEERAA